MHAGRPRHAARALASLLVAGAAACAPPPAPPPRTVVIGRAADAIALDPARVTDAESVEVCEQIFERLVRLPSSTSDPPPGSVRRAPEPALAVSWQVKDGVDYLFQLRPNVRFHDGTPFDARAVVFSLERLRDPKHPAHVDSPFADVLREVVKVEAVGALAVRIVLRAPFAPFLEDLATYPLSIVSPTAAARFGRELGEHPVGTGPFAFVEWKHGERITLARNRAFWGGAEPAAGAGGGGPVDRVAFVRVDDPERRLTRLEGSAVDVAESLAPQDLQLVRLHPSLRTLRVRAEDVAYLAMNTRRPPFDDPRVRRAVSLALGPEAREAIVRYVYQGLGDVALGLLPPDLRGAPVTPGETKPLADRQAEARALLREAGWPPPVALPLQLYLPETPRPYLPAPLRVGRMIAEDLREVGMEVDLSPRPMDELLSAVENGEHDLCLLGWTADSGDPDDVLYALLHSANAQAHLARNVSFVAEPRLDALLDEARRTLEPARRDALYAEVERLAAGYAPLVPIAHAEIAVAHRAELSGLALTPGGMLDLTHARLAAP